MAEEFSELLAQAIEEPDAVPETADPLDCPMCDFHGKTPRGLKKHMTMTHGVTAEKEDAKPRATRAPKFEKSLTEFYTTIGTAVMLINESDGAAIISNAENCAQALDKLAAENPKVRRALQKMLTGSAVGGVVIAHAPIVLALAANHLPMFQHKESSEE